MEHFADSEMAEAHLAYGTGESLKMYGNQCIKAVCNVTKSKRATLPFGQELGYHSFRERSVPLYLKLVYTPNDQVATDPMGNLSQAPPSSPLVVHLPDDPSLNKEGPSCGIPSSLGPSLPRAVARSRLSEFLNVTFNSSFHQSSRASPASVLIGRELAHSLLAMWGSDQLLVYSSAQPHANRCKKAFRCLKRAQKKVASIYNKAKTPPTFTGGSTTLASTSPWMLHVLRLVCKDKIVQRDLVW
uniref:Uncharacterized protein n=1 Tax=Timema poppense TaxID=170557 RepID=A0A7R9DDC7_TIMPO|nr:unnamed protein product [Timema poppensis]